MSVTTWLGQSRVYDVTVIARRNNHECVTTLRLHDNEILVCVWRDLGDMTRKSQLIYLMTLFKPGDGGSTAAVSEAARVRTSPGTNATTQGSLQTSKTHARKKAGAHFKFLLLIKERERNKQ